MKFIIFPYNIYNINILKSVYHDTNTDVLEFTFENGNVYHKSKFSRQILRCFEEFLRGNNPHTMYRNEDEDIFDISYIEICIEDEKEKKNDFDHFRP